ncbi:hypothetical protein [Streptomyces morookaense]|uniref:Lipoprotein n=1 Tax=Streptomyces morookaense TaxID=1970 RepID=A0A7Y7B9Y2_STRMO|nr:hypothetical protein [Streptomyces morookaense]NVK81625.1 hypothetical protein [Streptomyces morookaense]GHF09007.1 hypothetical protein GCM10010359_07940 [Streptomyces morookaense]
MHLRASATALALLLLAGCGSHTTQTARPSPTPPCHNPDKAVLPRTAGTITEADNGGRICVAHGQEIAVFLDAHTKDAHRHWQPITLQPGSAVTRHDNGMVTPTVSTTVGLFTPETPGEVQLTSHRESGETWRATLVVH